MTTHLSAEVVGTFLIHILTPVYRITEDDSVRDSRMGAFITALRDPLPTDDRVQMS
jgi:U3 small nucleolar RNA-associated protein 20